MEHPIPSPQTRIPQARPEAPSAELVEVFSGLQGEGLYVGCRQLFLRFAGCNLRCCYCDTPESWTLRPTCRVERAAGARTWQEAPNPLTVAVLLRFLAPLLDPPGLHHSVALTGGEPLLHAPFLKALLPPLRAGGHRIFLETNGTRVGELAQVADLVDIVAMDLKLPSATGQPARYEEHRQFLRLARRREVFVKIIIARATSAEEVAGAAALVAGEDRAVPVVLQPVTPAGAAEAPTPGQVLALHAVAARLLAHVRVIPQTHKLIGQK